MLLAVISYPVLILTDYYLIQEIRARYDIDNHKFIKPHFTFIFPCSGINQDDFCGHVEKRIEGFNSFDFRINRVELNTDPSGDSWHLFLVPEKGFEQIIKLHDSLYTEILNEKLRTDIPYIPHITVGRFENERDGEKVYEEMNNQKLTISGRISTIEVIAIENNQLKTIRSFELLS